LEAASEDRLNLESAEASCGLDGSINRFEATRVMRIVKQGFPVVTILSVSLALVYGQKYEITPLVGGMYGGTVKLGQEAVSPNVLAHVDDSFSFGIAGGFRFDADDLGGDVCEACNLIEFRYLRQDTHLGLKQDLLVPTPLTNPVFRPSVTFDNFLADFTREWPIEDARKIRPFGTVSLGAVRISSPASSLTRFVFGIGAGLKVFPKPRWGILFQVEYLPIVLQADVQRLVCTAGCIVLLGGGLMNRFEFSIGPTFRFGAR